MDLGVVLRVKSQLLILRVLLTVQGVIATGTLILGLGALIVPWFKEPVLGLVMAFSAMIVFLAENGLAFAVWGRRSMFPAKRGRSVLERLLIRTAWSLPLRYKLLLGTLLAFAIMFFSLGVAFQASSGLQTAWGGYGLALFGCVGGAVAAPVAVGKGGNNA